MSQAELLVRLLLRTGADLHWRENKRLIRSIVGFSEGREVCLHMRSGEERRE